MMTGADNRNKGNPYALLVFIPLCVVSLFLRQRIFPILTSDTTQVLTAGADSPYYLRLFDLAVANFPSMPTGIDYYSNYPWGLEHFLPPVWPSLLAAISIPLSSISGLGEARIAGTLMLILGIATAIPIYFLAREMFGRKAALTSAALALFLPDMILAHQKGIDHHLVDIFLVASIFALFLGLNRAILQKSIRRAIALTTAGGLLIALSMLISLSLVLVISLTLLPVMIAVFILRKADLMASLAALGGLFGAAALSLGLVALLTPWFSSTFEFSRLSYLHIAIFTSIALVGATGFAVLRAGVRLPIFRAMAVIAGVSLIVAFATMPQIYQTLLESYWRSIGSYPLGTRTLELMPLIVADLGLVIDKYSYMVFVLPLVVVGLAIKDIRSRSLSFEHIFFYALLVALGFYTLQARYYGIYFSIFVSIAYGIGISQGAYILHDKVLKSRYKGLGLNGLGIIGTVLVIVVMFLGAITTKPIQANSNFFELVNYIKTHTASPGNYYEPAKRPTYGILCNWGDGYRLQYLAERGVVATGNHDAGMEGIVASERFNQALSEETGLQAIKNLGVKYVVAAPLLNFWVGDISKIGEPAREPNPIVRCLSQDEIYNDASVVAQVRQTMAARLYYDVIDAQNSSRTPTKEPLHHFRLLYISDSNQKATAFVLYELVKGAQIKLEAAPDKKVMVTTDIKTNNGKKLLWTATGKTDSRGVFSTVAPYSTGDNNATIDAAPYRVQVGDSVQQLDVDEGAVVAGDEIILRF